MVDVKKPRAKRHHFLSQMYLQGFTDNDKDPREGKLAVVDFERKTCYLSTVDRTAFIRHYNSITADDGRRDPIFEELRAKLEGVIAPCLSMVVGGQEQFEDLDTCLGLVAMHLASFPDMRKHQELMWRTMRETLEGVYSQGVPQGVSAAQRIVIERLQTDFSSVPVQDLKDLVSWGLPDEAYVKMGSHFSIYTYWEGLRHRRWSLHRALPDAGLFVTSDRPVIIATRDSSVWSTQNLDDPDTLIVFPLSKRAVLVGHPESSHKAPIIDRDFVSCTNRYLFEHADFIYAPLQGDCPFVSDPGGQILAESLRELGFKDWHLMTERDSQGH